LANSGVFNIDDINFLRDNQQYPTLGQLELIQTQEYLGAVSTINFTNIKESTYNVHFMTFSEMSAANDNIHTMNIRFYESGVLETANYKVARQNVGANPSVGFNQSKSDSSDKMPTLFGSGNASNENDAGFVYFYNLGDSRGYSYCTFHTLGLTNESYFASAFGSGVLPQQSVVDGIQILVNSGNYNSFKVSLFGIRFS
jgi:hypothetical protein